MAQSIITVFMGYERSDGDNGETVLVHGAVFPDAIYSLRFTNDHIAARLSTGLIMDSAFSHLTECPIIMDWRPRNW